MRKQILKNNKDVVFNMNKGFLLLFLVLLASFVSADTLSSYVVPSSVALGNNVTATGLFQDTNANKAGFLCSFYFFDSLTNDLVKRATDQYTTSTGRVTMSGFPITEPLFKRGKTYILRTECGATSADANFLVAQRETIAEPANQDFEFLTNPENTDTAFIWIIAIAFLLFVGGVFLVIFKWGRR